MYAHNTWVPCIIIHDEYEIIRAVIGERNIQIDNSPFVLLHLDIATEYQVGCGDRYPILVGGEMHLVGGGEVNVIVAGYGVVADIERNACDGAVLADFLCRVNLLSEAVHIGGVARQVIFRHGAGADIQESHCCDEAQRVAPITDTHSVAVLGDTRIIGGVRDEVVNMQESVIDMYFGGVGEVGARAVLYKPCRPHTSLVPGQICTSGDNTGNGEVGGHEARYWYGREDQRIAPVGPFAIAVRANLHDVVGSRGQVVEVHVLVPGLNSVPRWVW